MKYAKHRSELAARRPRSQTKKRSWLWILGVIAVVFVVGMMARSGEPNKPNEAALNAALDEIVEEQTEAPMTASDKEPEQIVLEYVGDEGTGSGVARRGTAGELFTHVIVAELPPINTSTHFYEGWLVKPGVTEFFSTGEMFARADGKWGLVWEVSVSDAPRDVADYAKVVITLEPRDQNDAPAPEHVLEGVFED